MADLHNKTRGWETQWSKEEDEILINNYPIFGWEKVIEILPHRNKSGIQQRAFKLGIKKLTYNKDYFTRINTPEKAYWLGFIYADGYVTTGNRWGIELSSVDQEHLQKLIECLDSNIRLKFRKRKRFTKEIEMCGFQINNKKMYKDLVSKGVLNNKTYILQFPDENTLPKEYYSDFIRGLYDGDGSFTITSFNSKKDKIYNYIVKEISLVCKNKKFAEDLVSIINSEVHINARLNYVNRDDLYSIRISNKKDCLMFINYLYNTDNICLYRKYLKAQEIKKYCLT
jgi:hypothetical protein